MVRTCEVALPLPLRTTFTYRIPEELDEPMVTGTRVVVPFRNRSMLGVVLGRSDSPDGASLKSVSEILDPIPALSSCLVELGRWISNYYLSPIGETLRAMLPPSVRHQGARMQKIVAWTGQDVLASLRPSEQRIGLALAENGGTLALAALLKMAHVSRTVVQRLVKAGRLVISEEPLEPEHVSFANGQLASVNSLNAEQTRIMEAIEVWLQGGGFHPALLYGVTGSGKTEVYLRAVETALALGRTAIILVPEIALTMWISNICRARFGNSIAVLHSALTEKERAREWWRVRRQEVRVVVGTRSAVFAPLEKIGLIVIDEEQESSYKQEEAPRYNGRDVALMRAKLEGAVALLGSATPSLETYHRAREGKYTLLCLHSRVENRPMAAVRVTDLREDFRRTHKTTPISQDLREAIARELTAGRQSIVLVNRRGYSWFALCRSCGATILCENCSIALTYHKERERLACHYCGFSRPVPRVCPKCNSEHIYFVGAGSEQVEEHLRMLFPQARIARLDRDAVRHKWAFGQVLSAFGSGEIDILVGTQMVAKGHDFHGVTLVGVASADAQLGFPDFRAAERTFQLLTQVAGRAGRGPLPGQVIVESYHPEHYAIQLAASQDYVSFFEKELHFRRLMHYPPLVVLASVLVRSAKLEKAIRWSRQIETFFGSQKMTEIKILGPAAAPLARLKGEYRFHFLLKSRRRAALNQILNKCLAYCVENEIPDRSVLIDVDPVNLM